MSWSFSPFPRNRAPLPSKTEIPCFLFHEHDTLKCQPMTLYIILHSEHTNSAKGHMPPSEV